MPASTEHDRPLLECLHQLVFGDAECVAAIEDGLQRAAQRFSDPQYRSAYSSVTLPIGLFRDKLPESLRDAVRLCRVFTIRAGQRAPHEEIHRNSVQRLVSVRGNGTVNSAQPGGVDRNYTAHQISSPDPARTVDIARCWDVVAQNTWHFPQARGNTQWYGVAFHSASADEIVDEYVAL